MNDETDGRTDGWMFGECSMLRQSVADYLWERVIIREELGWGIGYPWGRGNRVCQWNSYDIRKRNDAVIT